MKSWIQQQILWFVRKVNGDRVDSYSAQVSFFIIIAFIPFVLFLLALLQTVNVNGTNFITAALHLLPPEIEKFLSFFLEQNREPIALISAAALTCLWSSSKAMLALIKGLNSVFDVAETRNFIWLRVVAIGYTAAFALILAVTAVILVFGNTLLHTFFRELSAWQSVLHIKSILGFTVLFVFFTFTYKIIPRKAKTPLRRCALGAAVAAAGWVLFSYFFSLFVENFSNYSGMYGSLAALVIFMLWLYFCMYILLLGGIVSTIPPLKNPAQVKQKPGKTRID